MPYAPGIQSDFSPLFAGIQNLGKNIQAFADKRKQESQEATTLRKLMSIYAPDQKDALPSMGLKELRANAAQYAARQQKAQMDMQQQEAAARMANMQADNSRADQFLGMQLNQFAATKGRQDRADAEAETLRKATTGFARDFAAGPPLVLRPDMIEKFAGPAGKIDYALGRNPDAIRDPGFQHFVQFVSRMREDDPNLVGEFVEDPTNGNRFYKSGRQVLPSGVNPEKVNTKIEPLHDFDGKPVPGFHLLRDSKGRMQLVRTPEAKITKMALPGDPGFSGTPEQYANYLLSLDKQNGGVANESTPDSGGNGLPMPKTKTELKSGVVYQTKHGPAKWNGNQFEATK